MLDHEIIKLYNSRDELAIAETEKSYGGYLRTVAKNILHSAEDTEECVNDTYFKVWNRIPPDVPRNLSTYLAGIARNTAIDRRRREKAHKRGEGEYSIALEELENCISGELDPYKAAESKLLSSLISQFLSRESEERRGIFVMRYYYFDPIAKIAENRGYSEEKIKSILFRMRNKLAKELEKEGFLI